MQGVRFDPKHHIVFLKFFSVCSFTNKEPPGGDRHKATYLAPLPSSKAPGQVMVHHACRWESRRQEPEVVWHATRVESRVFTLFGWTPTAATLSSRRRTASQGGCGSHSAAMSTGSRLENERVPKMRSRVIILAYGSQGNKPLRILGNKSLSKALGRYQLSAACDNLTGYDL